MLELKYLFQTNKTTKHHKKQRKPKNYMTFDYKLRKAALICQKKVLEVSW